MKQRWLLTTSHRQTDAHSVSYGQNPVIVFFPWFLLFNMILYGTKYPFGQLRPPETAAFLLSLLTTPAYLLGSKIGEKRESLDTMQTLQQQPEHSCVINTVSTTNPKHGTIGAADKKFNSISARSTMESWFVDSFRQSMSLVCYKLNFLPQNLVLAVFHFYFCV